MSTDTDLVHHVGHPIDLGRPQNNPISEGDHVAYVAPAVGGTIDYHPTFRRIIGELPLNVRMSLTFEQAAALSVATRPQPTPHLLQFRISIPLLWRRRYYFALFFGPERRSLKRLQQEGQLGARLAGVAYIVGLTFLIGAGTILLFSLLYIIKSALGIDLFDGPSPLHDLLY